MKLSGWRGVWITLAVGCIVGQRYSRLDGPQLTAGVRQPRASMINEILRQDERGRTEAEFPDPHALTALLADHAPDTHCLQYIDHYGDTVFNRGQIARLIAEVQERATGLPAESQPHVHQLVAFLQAAADEPHMYVRFVGD